VLKLDLLNDPRDLPFVRVILSASLIIPAALYLYLPGRFDWRLALVYWLVWALVFVDRVTLMLHCTSHRPLFSRRVHWMNAYVPWILAPFYGQSPSTYFAHHIAMHHVEDNFPEDLSSTMRYRRDRFLDWGCTTSAASCSSTSCSCPPTCTAKGVAGSRDARSWASSPSGGWWPAWRS